MPWVPVFAGTTVNSGSRMCRRERHALWDLRPSGRQRSAAEAAFRGAVKAYRGIRPRRLLRLSSCRTPQHAARLCAVTRYLLVCCRAADPPVAVRADGLPLATLSSAPADRRDLHARPDERRTVPQWSGPRHLADRGRVLRRQLRYRDAAVP